MRVNDTGLLVGVTSKPTYGYSFNKQWYVGLLIIAVNTVIFE